VDAISVVVIIGTGRRLARGLPSDASLRYTAMSHALDSVDYSPKRSPQSLSQSSSRLKYHFTFTHLTFSRADIDISIVSRFVSCVYRAMHFSAKRGIAIACRLSVRLSVCL